MLLHEIVILLLKVAPIACGMAAIIYWAVTTISEMEIRAILSTAAAWIALFVILCLTLVGAGVIVHALKTIGYF